MTGVICAIIGGALGHVFIRIERGWLGFVVLGMVLFAGSVWNGGVYVGAVFLAVMLGLAAAQPSTYRFHRERRASRTHPSRGYDPPR